MKDETLRATVSIKTKLGVPALITIPAGTTFKELSEFMSLVAQVDTESTNNGFTADIKGGYSQNKAPVTITPPKDLGKCSKCGADNAFSKNGKIYCSEKCWLKNSY